MISPTRCSLSETALTVLRARYLRCDENGVPVETPERLFERVATASRDGVVFLDNVVDDELQGLCREWVA